MPSAPAGTRPGPQHPTGLPDVSHHATHTSAPASPSWHRITAALDAGATLVGAGRAEPGGAGAGRDRAIHAAPAMAPATAAIPNAASQARGLRGEATTAPEGTDSG